MTSNDSKKPRGSRREGAGRRPTLQPLKAVRLHDPAIREALATLTAYEREMIEEPLTWPGGHGGRVDSRRA